MRHFDISSWVDYARGVLSIEERAALETHLQQNCPECQTTLALFERITRTARSERDTLEVPLELIEAARSIFPAPNNPENSLLRRLSARLIFDGFAGMRPVGARSNNAAAHLMFEAEDFCVDLREEAEQNSLSCSLVGQIAQRSAPHVPVAQVPVLLLAGEKVIAQAVSNSFGEFCLEYVPQDKLRLAIPIAAAGVRIELSLNKFTGRQ